ncbi:MAG: multicopper oxidase family protein, partial [Candidatus Eremiobacteraeota bacterium]|nr:multicopper oxidase family protein [Candidatus Eremiobacteraeota bacterium]
QMDPTAILTTNIHTHGLQVDPRGNGDNPFVSILPGQYKDYEIRIPENHPTGLFWYHPHVHMTTSRQGWNGLSGAIIVEGGLDDHPEISQMQERLMVVNELLLDQNGQVPFGVVLPIAGFVPFTTLPALPTDICFPVNGVDNPTVTIRPGEVQRWRLLNASPHRALELSLEGHEIYQVAQDGIHFEAPKRRDKLVVAAGNRVEFLVKAGQAGTYELLALPRDQGHPGGARPQRTILTMDVGGQPTEMSIPTTLLPSPMPDISQNSIVQQRGVQFEGGILSAPVVFKLDGQVFDANRIDNSVESGTTEEWTLVNNDVFEHPFHIHVNPFQIVKINGEPYAEPEVWWDTIFLPAKGTVTVRMRFRPDVVGKTVYHCHILPHEDNGMMSAFTLNPPGEDFPDLPTTGPFGSGEPLPLAPQPSIGGDPDRPYVFTQASDGLTAMVDQGGRVQIQLPGGPSVWSVVDVDTDKLEPLQSEVIPSPGRIEGTDSIYQFDFRKKGPESTTVTLVANPPVSWLQNPYTLTVTSRL